MKISTYRNTIALGLPQAGAVMRTESDGRTRYVNKGIKKGYRQLKREEAEERNTWTLPERRSKKNPYNLVRRSRKKSR